MRDPVAAIIYLPPLQGIFQTAALGPAQLALLATFPFVVWGSDEIHRAFKRRAVDGSAGGVDDSPTVRNPTEARGAG